MCHTSQRPAAMELGDRVRLLGLVGVPELNGELGTATEFGIVRATVRVDSDHTVRARHAACRRELDYHQDFVLAPMPAVRRSDPDDAKRGARTCVRVRNGKLERVLSFPSPPHVVRMRDGGLERVFGCETGS